MKLTLSDLTKEQRRLLVRLGDDFPHEDSVGVEVEKVRPELLLTVGSMMSLGLVEERHGWRGSVWLRLTEAGRQVEDGGPIG